jgi:hypothetical protein
MTNPFSNPKILELKETNIAWLAGLFEGEASFQLDKRSRKRYRNSTSPPNPFIKIAMVDEDVISKVSELVNKSYFSPKRLTSTGKQVYICHIGDRATLFSLLPRRLPYMEMRRQNQIKQCLAALQEYKIWYRLKSKE